MRSCRTDDSITLSFLLIKFDEKRQKMSSVHPFCIVFACLRQSNEALMFSGTKN